MSTTSDTLRSNTTEASPKPTEPNPSNVDRARDKMHETVDRVADKAHQAEASLREQAAGVEGRMREMGAKVSESAHDGTEQLRNYVRENPVTSAGIAFAAGFVISAILRR